MVLSSVAACDDGLDLKLYAVSSRAGALIREDESHKCTDTKVDGYICMSPGDAEALFNFCFGDDPVVKDNGITFDQVLPQLLGMFPKEN